MTTRNTAILAAITLLLGVYVIGLDREPNDGSRDFRVVPIAREAADIVGLKIRSAAGEIVLARGELGSWEMTAPVSDRADGQKIDELLGELVSLKKIDSFHEDAPPESVLGFGNGALSIGVTTKGGDTGTLVLGADAALAGDIYARWEDDAPFLCLEDARDLASLPHSSLRDIRLLAIPPDMMRRVKIKDETEAQLLMEQAEPKTPWRILKPFEVLADKEAVDKRLNLLASMGAKEFIDNPNGDVCRGVRVWCDHDLRAPPRPEGGGRSGFGKVRRW